MEDATKHPRYEDARRHVRELRGFYSHLTVYLVVNAALLTLNFLTSPGRWWAFYPMFGWGIGLLAHGFSVYAYRGWLGDKWEERKIREFLDRRD